MIVLLSCSINSLGSDSNQYLFYGGASEDDSIKIYIDDIRTVNSKLVELKYEKETNRVLRGIVSTDSVIIVNNSKTIRQLKSKVKKTTKQRNVIGVAGAASIILFIISIL